jgi:hypothetical protein
MTHPGRSAIEAIDLTRSLPLGGESVPILRLTVSILENEVRHIRRAEMEHGHAAPSTLSS